jgi:hypothetical protein
MIEVLHFIYMVYSQIWLNPHKGDHHVFLHFRINAFFFSGELSPFFLTKKLGDFFKKV